ncbi:RICIN domain-containing protein [Streptomyces sp. NPDC006335]|uniref:RICIN domain-containing protein n=1 Tax=Streptomyces sp. NPDC006335 TaxID=3156895 RepID=UPI0033AB8749
MKRLITALALAGVLVTEGSLPAVAAHAPPTEQRAAAPNKCAQRNTYKNVGRGDYLSVWASGGKGAKIVTWPRNGAANQSWCMEKAREGGWYFHPSYNLSLCMDSPNSSNDAPILWTCKGNANQRFNVSGGFIQLRRDGDYVTHAVGGGNGRQVFMSGGSGWGSLSRWS